ncbi:protein serine threonine kinase [Chrysochromulina tobinii]|uniref:Protein serine threonine kinase n=1 Tax=Chrysochromulina tobinii TaxID=1460289 RepID=A0A0M0J8X3_9EUKA|nr:protein serine threonine kinase [Chrysochromulina tobinii]|eukprot:KOO22683.1 protein serine threonine kinase [Chrysochromulina sp. CCMP291]
MSSGSSWSLCPHGSLLDVLRTIEQPFAEEQIALACRDALRALQYMHTQGKGIIHRDVKCANLLLGDGIVKLADLGIALQLNSTASKRMSMIGTPHWMAPEVVGYGKYDARADVWSLGIAAIEMAQGEPPHYDLRPILRVMFAIAKEQPPTLRNPSAASASFNDFLMKMLTKEMTSRPSSTEMLQHPFVAGEGGEGLDPNASGLHALVHAVQEAVAYKLANPTPEHASHDSLNWGGSTCTVGSVLSVLSKLSVLSMLIVLSMISPQRVAFKMTKHILRAAEFLRDLVARLVIEVRHLPGRVMVADLLTKAVARVVYHELLRLFDTYAATGVVCPD